MQRKRRGHRVESGEESKAAPFERRSTKGCATQLAAPPAADSGERSARGARAAGLKGEDVEPLVALFFRSVSSARDDGHDVHYGSGGFRAECGFATAGSSVVLEVVRQLQGGLGMATGSLVRASK